MTRIFLFKVSLSILNDQCSYLLFSVLFYLSISFRFQLLTYSLRGNAVLIHNMHGSNNQNTCTHHLYYKPKSYCNHVTHLDVTVLPKDFLGICERSCSVLRINIKTNQEMSLFVCKYMQHKASQGHKRHGTGLQECNYRTFFAKSVVCDLAIEYPVAKL